MIAAEVDKYKQIVTKKYPEYVKVEDLKGLIKNVDQDDPYWKKVINVAKTDTQCILTLLIPYSFTNDY